MMYVFSEEKCIACGAPVPEGRQVCPLCEAKYHTVNLSRPAIPAPGLVCRIRLWLKHH